MAGFDHKTDVVLSLFAGIFPGTFMLSLKGGIISAFQDGFIKLNHEVLGSLANPWNAGIVFQCLTIGGLTTLVSKMGGAKAMAEALLPPSGKPLALQTPPSFFSKPPSLPASWPSSSSSVNP
jgi:hypothetical protein